MEALSDESGYRYLKAKRVLDTLNNFTASADETFKLEHVPEVSLEGIENLSEDNSDEVQAGLGNEAPKSDYLNSTRCKKVS